MKWLQALAVIFFALWLITALCLVAYYETDIEQTAIKNSIVLADWEDLAGDYAKLTDMSAELLKKKTKRIWKLKALLRKCKNNRYYRVRNN